VGISYFPQLPDQRRPTITFNAYNLIQTAIAGTVDFDAAANLVPAGFTPIALLSADGKTKHAVVHLALNNFRDSVVAPTESLCVDRCRRDSAPQQKNR